MKSWQVILINGCVTVLAVFAAIGISIPDAPADRTKEVLDALNEQINSIRAKLSSIEDTIQKQKEQVSVTPSPSQSAKNPEDLDKLDRKLDMILGKLSVIENRSVVNQGNQSFGRSFGPPPMIPRQLPPSISAKGQKPTSWIDRLPDDKKREVEIIFEDHAVRLRDKLPPPDPNGNLPDRETVSRVMEENDLLLKQELKTILTDEEYQQFLDSHPSAAVKAPSLPSISGNQ